MLAIVYTGDSLVVGDALIMKTVILAGGLGTRLSEETSVRPKPMVDIGGRPILWHIMKIYAAAGVTEFVLALGYRSDVIESFVRGRAPAPASASPAGSGAVVSMPGDDTGAWTVHLVDTGLETQTGGRLKRVAPLLAEGTFLMTYGDGVADLDVGKVLAFHRAHGKLATVTAVRPPARFGAIELDGPLVRSFTEKPQVGEGWINGGFFVLEPGVFDYLDGDDTSFEHHVLDRLARLGQLAAYRHEGFWQCMDTLRDVRHLNALWEDAAPWAIWRRGLRMGSTVLS